MSISLNTTNSVQTSHESTHAIKTAKLAQSQQEAEGQMALNLIQSADLSSLPAPTASSGNNVNIKV